MNKRIVVFICILSLLVPFLPSFDFTLHAFPYVPSESENSWIDDLQVKFQTYFGNNGIVANSDWYNTDYVGGFWEDLLNYCGFEKLPDKDFASSVYEYAITTNQSADMIFNDSSQYMQNVLEEKLPYYIYDFININDFFTFYNFSNYSMVNSNLSTFKTALESYCSDSNYVYLLTSKSRSGMNYLYDSSFVKIPRSFFDSGYLVLSSGSFSDIVNYRFQSFRITADGSSVPSNVNLNGYLSLSDGLSFVSSFDGLEIYDVTSKNGGNAFNNFSRVLGTLSNNPFRIGLIQSSTGWFSNTSFVGTAFIYSGESFSVPVFRSTNLISDFLSGNSPVYKFNKEIDLGQFGEDIDYSKLYDIISTTVQGNTGNVIDSINNVANNYLQQQLDLLHDINNALNDGTGQSWLRRIYNILDFNFPQTLSAFSDLIVAVENISVNGGGSDLTHINRVIDEINDKLGFLIEEPLSDATVDDIESLKNLAQQKFPFCIFSDVVAISVVLNRPPVQPHWEIPLKLPDSSSVNNIVVDLSWYEEVRDLVQGVFIFIFIVGLLALSVKIFNALKS